MYSSEMLCMKTANNVDSCKHDFTVQASEMFINVVPCERYFILNPIVTIISFARRRRRRKIEIQTQAPRELEFYRRAATRKRNI